MPFLGNHIYIILFLYLLPGTWTWSTLGLFARRNNQDLDAWVRRVFTRSRKSLVQLNEARWSSGSEYRVSHVFYFLVHWKIVSGLYDGVKCRCASFNLNPGKKILCKNHHTVGEFKTKMGKTSSFGNIWKECLAGEECWPHLQMAEHPNKMHYNIHDTPAHPLPSVPSLILGCLMRASSSSPSSADFTICNDTPFHQPALHLVLTNHPHFRLFTIQWAHFRWAYRDLCMLNANNTTHLAYCASVSGGGRVGFRPKRSSSSRLFVIYIHHMWTKLFFSVCLSL